MKIVYSTDQVYLHGGIEKMLAQKLNYLVSIHNVEVHLITTEQKEKPYCYPISDKVIHHDLGINYVRTKSYFSPVNFKKVPKHIKKLKNKLNDIKPNVLIVCNFSFDFYFIPFINSEIKTIKEFHSSRYYYIKELANATVFNKLLFKINNRIEKKYSHIVLLNDDEKKYYSSNNLEVIPNAICGIKLKSGVERKKIIIAAGRIAKVKQFDHLIKIWNLLYEKFPTWIVHIYGEGDEVLSNELQTIINELEVQNIYLKGATSSLNKKMQEASIYALTSATECFPMVLLESLANGLPIISYNCPHGPRNIISNNNDGVLVETNNIPNFSKELSDLIKNDEKRTLMEKKAIENIKRFSEQVVMKKWIQLFNE